MLFRGDWDRAKLFGLDISASVYIIEYTDMRMSSYDDTELHVAVNIGIIAHRNPVCVRFSA
jgi:hypothetical protein